MKKIISRNKSIIPACDVPFEKFEDILEGTKRISGVGGYKLPHRSGRKGWESWVELARKHTNKPLIYDGQKLGNDMPHVADGIMKDLRESEIDAVILYPLIHPTIEEAWIKAAQDNDLGVIVGGETTYNCIIGGDEGGFVLNAVASEIYYCAAQLGVTNFGVPGTRPNKIKLYRERVKSSGIENPVFYSPGFITQGGKISDGVKAAGERFHPIVGRGIYWNKGKGRFSNVDEIRKATQNLVKKLQ